MTIQAPIDSSWAYCAGVMAGQRLMLDKMKLLMVYHTSDISKRTAESLNKMANDLDGQARLDPDDLRKLARDAPLTMLQLGQLVYGIEREAELALAVKPKLLTKPDKKKLPLALRRALTVASRKKSKKKKKARRAA